MCYCSSFWDIYGTLLCRNVPKLMRHFGTFMGHSGTSVSIDILDSELALFYAKDGRIKTTELFGKERDNIPLKLNEVLAARKKNFPFAFCRNSTIILTL